MRLIGQIRRKDYLLRHVSNFLPHLTVPKILNLVLNVFEEHYVVSSPRSLPLYLKIEPTPLCQLRCEGCPHGLSSYNKQFSRGMQMSLDDFKRVVDPLSRSLLGISFSFRGEPLLHEDLASLIAYAHKRKIAASFASNLSMRLDERSIDALVKSGLDSLLVSLDGASEETYGKYRVGGSFSRVLENVRSISDAKKRNGLRRPRIIWKFVVFDHNEHEVEVVTRTHGEHGFDGFELVRDRYSKANQEELQAFKASMHESRTACYWLWHTMIIGWDGEVFPCCEHGGFDLGNAISQDSREIWRSDAYRLLRQGFSTEGQMNSTCSRCLGLAVSNSSRDAAPRDSETSAVAGA